MADAPPSSTFLRFLREAMADIGSGGGDIMRGARSGADEFASSPRGRAMMGGGAMMGGLAGAYMSGANGQYQDDPNAEALTGGAMGGLAGGAAGLAGAGAVGGGRGGARALRMALKRMLREPANPPASAGMQPVMAIRRQLQQLLELQASLDPNDPRMPQITMAIQSLQQQLGELG